MQEHILAVSKIASDVTDGNINPLKAYIELKQLEKVLSDTISKIQDDARNEADNYGMKSFEAFGANVELRNAASRWDYSNVHQVVELDNKLKTMKKLAEQAVNAEVYDEKGCIIEPAIKIEGKATIAISLKK